jgi:hypothetical protein
MMNQLYSKKIYIDILEKIKDFQKITSARKMIITKDPNLRQHYDETELNDALNDLINCELIDYTEQKTIHITDPGKQYYQDYYRFKMLNFFAKLSEVINKNLVPIISILALIISIISLFLNKR